MPLPIVETQLKRFNGDSTDREAVVKDLRKNSESMGVWSGGAAIFEACHFFNGALASVENFSHVVLQLKEYNGNTPPSRESESLVEVIVAAADFDTTVDETSAADFSKAHFKFALTDEQMAQTGTKWLLCFARTISGNTITLKAGTITFTEDGGPSVTAPGAVASSAWTKGEADARFLQAANRFSEIAAAGSSAQAAARNAIGAAPATLADAYRFKTGSAAFQLWNNDQGTWHTLTLVGADGAVQLAIADGEAADSSPDDEAGDHALSRFSAGGLQLLNTDSNLYHTLTVSGAANEMTLQIGTGQP